MRRNLLAGIPGKILIVGKCIIYQHAYFDDPFIIFKRCFVMGHHHWPGINEVRSYIFQHPALAQRLTYQHNLAVDQISQASVNHLGRGRRCGPGKIIFFQKGHFQPPRGCLISHRSPADASADNNDIKMFICMVFNKPLHVPYSFFCLPVSDFLTASSA